MHGQIHFSDQFTIAGALVGWRPVVRGAQAGLVATPDLDNDTSNVILTDVRSLTQRVDMVDGETWVVGQRLYLQLVNGVPTITVEETDLFFGFADGPKAANDENSKIRIKEPGRDKDQFEILIDFNNHTHLQPDATYSFRNFLGEGGARWAFADANALTTRPGLEFEHDGALAPDSVTISIGDGTGGNAQVLAATAFSVIQGLGPGRTPLRQTIASSPAAVLLTDVAITLSGGPMTAGRLRIRLNLSAT